MALSSLVYTKNWTEPTDFPTYEEDESVVRSDIQLLHDEAKNKINEIIVVVNENSAERHTHANKTALDTVPTGGVVTVVNDSDNTVPTCRAVLNQINSSLEEIQTRLDALEGRA